MAWPSQRRCWWMALLFVIGFWGLLHKNFTRRSGLFDAKSMSTTTKTTTKRVVRLVVVSDTHGHHDLLTPHLLPAGDVLLHCGDFSHRGSRDTATRFVAWISALSQYPEKFVIDGNHDRQLHNNNNNNYNNPREDRPDSVSSGMDLAELFAHADPSVRWLQDESVTTRDGLVIHGSSWKSCEADAFDHVVASKTTAAAVDVWMVHQHPFLDPTSVARAAAVLGKSPSHSSWTKGWLGSRTIAQLVQDHKIPLCLSGHVHYARGMVQPRVGQATSSSRVAPIFINAASLRPSRLGVGVSPPVVIDFDLQSRRVLHVQVEPHPD